MSSPALSARLQPLIGIFDSGVGGLSVLRALHDLQPAVRALYFADSAHAPYGERSDAYIAARTHRIAHHLLAHGASMLVLACNTASAVAAAELRARWPGLAVVAVEPGLKPAVAATRNRRIGVMGTPATLRSDKFKRLLSAHGVGVHVQLQPCAGLALAIERGAASAAHLHHLIDTYTQPLRKAEVDTVVLGCTHYPFVRAQIQAALGPDVQLIDTAQAVARQALRLLSSRPAHCPSPHSSGIVLHTTGAPAQLQRLAQHWLPPGAPVVRALGV